MLILVRSQCQSVDGSESRRGGPYAIDVVDAVPEIDCEPAGVGADHVVIPSASATGRPPGETGEWRDGGQLCYWLSLSGEPGETRWAGRTVVVLGDWVAVFGLVEQTDVA